MINAPGFQSHVRSAGIPLLVLCICVLAGTSFAADPAVEERVFDPSDSQSNTSKIVLGQLQLAHYRRLAIDDDLSSELLDRYLEYLDPARSYLLEADIQEFEGYRLGLDDALNEGDLDPAFSIYDRFQKRRIDRIEFLEKLLAEELDLLDFDGDDYIDLKREDAPWPRDREEWDDLWRRRFKNDVLNQKMADRSLEEIKESLGGRYRNRLRRAEQTTANDVFLAYLTAVTHGYDPHTVYFPPRSVENFDIEMSLSFEGIGALLNSDGEFVKVVRLIAAGPAEKGGELQPGDRIVGVGQGGEGELVDIVGWRVDEAVDLIRGPKGTVVRLAVIPANEPDSGPSRMIQLTRNTIQLEEQAAKSRLVEIARGDGDDNSAGAGNLKIGIIELPAFYMDFEAAYAGDPNYRSSTRDVARLVAELETEGVDGIVIDLRGNGGGSLREARELTGLFAGRSPVVQIRRSSGIRRKGGVQVLWNDEEDPAFNGPVAVIVDRLSASASEIFAAAIQDLGRGVVVGGRTFGKGTVQSLVDLGEGELKMTSAKFYRISGASTQNRGMIPDILFPPVYASDEIGESSLETALPWDEINPVEFSKSSMVREFLPLFQRLHSERAASAPEFVALSEQLALFEEERSKTRVTLNEKLRRSERNAMEAELLAVENRRRVALGDEPIESLDELDAEGDAEKDADDDIDPFAMEAARILTDLIEQMVPATARVP